eukprot:9277791-Heterocapsa_arctica.AAC.1
MRRRRATRDKTDGHELCDQQIELRSLRVRPTAEKDASRSSGRTRLCESSGRGRSRGRGSRGGSRSEGKGCERRRGAARTTEQ